MPIDPVIPLAEEIRVIEREVAVTIKHVGAHDRMGMKTVSFKSDRLRILYNDLLETSPTSVLGAAELIRFAAERLSFGQDSYAQHLRRIAERLSGGERQQSDLIWLRALAVAVDEEADGSKANKDTAKLLALAVNGMAMPVVVWRAAVPTHAPMRNLRSLLSGPGEIAPRPFVPRGF